MRFPKGCNILYNWGYALDTLSIPNPFLLSKCVHGFNWVKIWKSTLHEDSSHQWVQPFLLEATSSIFKEPHRPYPPNHPSMSFWLTCKNAHRLVGENGSSVTNFSGDFFFESRSNIQFRLLRGPTSFHLSRLRRKSPASPDGSIRLFTPRRVAPIRP